mgnify:FL=1
MLKSELKLELNKPVGFYKIIPIRIRLFSKKQRYIKKHSEYTYILI